MKCIFVQEKENKPIEKLLKTYQTVMKPKFYVCRLYITRGINIGGQMNDKNPYVKLSLYGQEFNLKGTLIFK
jgi:hypothetical protein